jgi:hypothetical protein
VFGRQWQIHTMLGFVALTLIGAQVVQLGVFARTYARVHVGERDSLLERFDGIRLEHGLLAGGALVLLALAGLAAVFAEWASKGFGSLGRVYEVALGVTILGLGIQIVFASFFLGLLTMRATERTEAASRANDAPLEPAELGPERPTVLPGSRA